MLESARDFHPWNADPPSQGGWRTERPVYFNTHPILLNGLKKSREGRGLQTLETTKLIKVAEDFKHGRRRPWELLPHGLRPWMGGRVRKMERGRRNDVRWRAIWELRSFHPGCSSNPIRSENQGWEGVKAKATRCTGTQVREPGTQGL